MAWIESHTVLLRHRKTKELALALNLKPVFVVGHLTALWHTALEQQEDGDLSKWSDELISEASAYEGNAKIFVEHLKNINWIEKNGLIHDWMDYAGRYLESKYRTSNLKRLKEIEKKHKSGFSRSKVCPKSPHLTLPNLDNLDNQKIACNGHLSDEDFLKSLKANNAYKGIDIDRELGKMDAWFLTPKGKGRKKTRRFIVSWLNKIDCPIEIKKVVERPTRTESNQPTESAPPPKEFLELASKIGKNV